MGEKKCRIGLLSDYLTSEYSDNLISGISNFCRENECDLLMFQVGDFHKQNPEYNNFEYASVVAHINSLNLDGLIINSSALLHSNNEEEYRSILKSFGDLKVVNIACELKDYHCVVSDFKQAYEELIDYLIKVQGCKKFALMGVKSKTPEVVARTEIFNEVLKKNEIDLNTVTYWESTFDYSSAYHEMTVYRKEHGVIDFDAIVALNDETAFASMDFCIRRMKMMIPNDIVITGFDNVQRSAFNNPTLTSVNQQIEFIGYTAAQTAYNLVKGNEVPMLQKIKAKAILRTSTAKNKEAQKNFLGNNFIAVDSRTARDFTSSFSVSEWYTKRNQILQAANFYNSVNANIPIDSVGIMIVNALRQFGLQGAAVVVYDHPIEMTDPFDYFKLPNKAKLIAGFDYELQFNTNNESEPIIFNPNEGILPPGKLKFPGCGTIVTALFRDFIHYGYVLIRCNAYDLGVYDLLQHSLSNLLCSSYEYTKFLEEKDKINIQNKKLDLIAHTDELTGLNNRRGFMDFGQSTLALCESMEKSGIVVFCDMDGLKYINDNFGHEAGDKAIKAQAEILNSSFRSNDVLGRIGGDEFALVCPGFTEKTFTKTKERIAKACKEWSKVNKTKFELSISMGCYAFPDEVHGYKLEELMAEADKLLYEEKKTKKYRRR